MERDRLPRRANCPWDVLYPGTSAAITPASVKGNINLVHHVKANPPIIAVAPKWWFSNMMFETTCLAGLYILAIYWVNKVTRAAVCGFVESFWHWKPARASRP